MSVANGYNACILAYGRTGSGKTHTMLGKSDPGSHGVTYRTLTTLFEALKYQQTVALRETARTRARQDRRDSVRKRSKAMTAAPLPPEATITEAISDDNESAEKTLQSSREGAMG